MKKQERTARNAQIVIEWERGDEATDIASRHQLTTERVYQILRAAGCDMRGPGRPIDTTVKKVVTFRVARADIPRLQAALDERSISPSDKLGERIGDLIEQIIATSS